MQKVTKEIPKETQNEKLPKQTLLEKMPQQSLQEEIFNFPQITDREAQQMRTYLKIPTEIKSLDPDWIKKAFAGQKLT